MMSAVAAIDHEGECAHAKARQAASAGMLIEAERLCRERGVRLTPIRRRVLEVLVGTHRPLGAYDIADALGQEERRRLAPITIYRALDFLLENGLAHRLETRNAFIACARPHMPGETIAFLMCENCGGVDEVVSPDIKAAIDDAARRIGFEPRLRVIEVAGICGHCRGR
jgi:Fur family zinc uptake transcriptional regulator